MLEKAKAEVMKINDAVDAKADEGMQKVKESRFTWAILGCAALAIGAIIALLAAY